jgi:hypothetical protein
VIQNQKEEFFLAAEVVVESRRADTRGGGYIADTGVMVALFREDPAGTLKDLNQLLIVAFLSGCHRHLILGASLDTLFGKLPEGIGGCKEALGRSGTHLALRGLVFS